MTKTHILHEISELVQDEEWCVRGVAVETLVDLIPSLDKGTVQDKVVSLLMQACDHAHTQGDNSLPIVAKQLGRMCYELKGMCVDGRSVGKEGMCVGRMVYVWWEEGGKNMCGEGVCGRRV